MFKKLDCWIYLCYFIFKDGKYDVKMKEVHILSTLKEINLVSNPARLKIIIMLGTTAKTAQDPLDALGVSGLKIHYHLRLFEENGIIEFVYTELINGITQKYYN